MAKLLLHIMLLGLLTAAVAGCTGTPDGRLTAADSLMWTRPDSSLIRLAEVDTCQLGEADRAYYALLLTQANYRNYIKATSDSMINRAVAYYEHHGPQERLTRALLYRGAVLDELGRPADAMLSYKKAEFAADTADYRNLAQIYMRIGDLYFDYYSNGLDIAKYRKAYTYYLKCGDSIHAVGVMVQIGKLLRKTDIPQSIDILKKCSQQAFQLCDTDLAVNSLECLSRAYFLNNEFVESKDMSVYVVRHFTKYTTDDAFLNAASAYAKLGNCDSAKYYLNNSNCDTTNSHQRGMYYYTLSRIADAQGQHDLVAKYQDMGDKINDNLSMNRTINDISKIELECNKQQIEQENRKKLEQAYLFSIGIFALVAFIILLYAAHRRKINRRNAHISQLRAKLTELDEKAIKERHDEILNNLEKEKKLQSIIERQIVVFQNLISTSYHNPTQLNKALQASFKLGDEGSNFWSELQYFVDENYNHIIGKCKKMCPELNDTELNLISLMCCGFSYIEIAICFGYSKDYIAVKRQRIAKKMQLSTSLINFIREEKGK